LTWLGNSRIPSLFPCHSPADARP